MTDPAVGTEGAEAVLDSEDFDWSLLENLDDDSFVDEDDISEISTDDDEEPVEGDEDGDQSEGDEPDEDEAEDEAPTTFTVKVDGVEMEVTLDELRSGYMRHADYTRKTQAVADEAKAAAAYRTLEQRLAADPDGTIAALRAELGLDQTDLQDLDPLEREVAELRAWRAEQERIQSQQAITAELAAVKQRYEDPNLDEDALLAFAVEKQIVDLDVAYRAMAYEARVAADKAAERVEAQRQEKVAAKRKAPKVADGGKRNPKVTTPGASDKPTIREALMAALREHS